MGPEKRYREEGSCILWHDFMRIVRHDSQSRRIVHICLSHASQETRLYATDNDI